MGFFLNEKWCQEKLRGISQERQVHILSIAHRSDQISVPDYLFSETYCGGYSGEDPPLPIPNREVKLTIADGTAPPGGRVGSCHFLIQVPDIIRCRGLLIYIPIYTYVYCRGSCIRLHLDVFSPSDLPGHV